MVGSAKSCTNSPSKPILIEIYRQSFTPPINKVRDEKNRLITEFAGRGMERSTSLISAVMRSLDTIHQEAISTAIPVVYDFAKRMQQPPPEIATLVRPLLESLGNSLLAGLPQAGFPDEWQLRGSLCQRWLYFTACRSIRLRRGTAHSCQHLPTT
jgi:hypothetical protein